MATNGIFQSVDGVGGYLHSYCPQSGLTGLWGQCGVTNKEPELSPQTVATCSHWHLLHSIPLKGDTGANQSSEPPLGAACTGHPGDLSSVGGLDLPPPPSLTILPLSCLVFLAPLPLHTCHDTGRLSQEGPLRRLLNHTAQTRSQITITPTSPLPCLSLVILTHPLGPEGQLHRV